jgi:hypothetical protein
MPPDPLRRRPARLDLWLLPVLLLAVLAVAVPRFQTAQTDRDLGQAVTASGGAGPLPALGYTLAGIQSFGRTRLITLDARSLWGLPAGRACAVQNPPPGHRAVLGRDGQCQLQFGAPTPAPPAHP